ncbi:porin [Rivibacter subsaxonicus]|uniref:Putative porin n=1 Tax=Rivibacter subsaxonicus TaxID=457575 RepID=A0A4Q7W2G0_9BURK|nr:porin [Rivibacter subsaxonicus]RZU02819.1 putative porin [Rivibacter subsaxonicus]
MSKRTSLATVRRSLIVSAALAAAATGASAQSNVTLFGRLDAALQYSTKTGTIDDDLYELANGGIRPSIWGMKGTEDLGSGLKAFFNLEAHFFTDNGLGARTGQAFRRQANVGVKSDWGAVTMGRQYSPAILANLGTEPRAFKENLSGLYPYALNQNPTNNTVNDLGIFIGNAVSYSGNFGPVYVGALLAAGEGTGRTMTLGASYTGPVVVSGSYQEIDAANSDSDGTTHYMLGLAVPLGGFTIKGSYQHATEDDFGIETHEVDFYGIGFDWAWNAMNTFNATYYYGKDKKVSGDKTSTFVISNDYAISKRTVIYAQFAIADADSTPSLRTGVILNGSFPNSKTSVVALGISHSF